MKLSIHDERGAFQFCNEAGINGDLMIAVTQPRRVAAVTLASRVASEMNCEVGQQVGYNVRFENVTTANTAIAYVTDGMLLREALHDPLLKRLALLFFIPLRFAALFAHFEL